MTDRVAPRRTGRWPLRATVGAAVSGVLAAGALLAGAGTASAHAVLESTDPPSGVVLAAPPATVSLRFGETVQLPPGGLRVFGPDGVQVDDENGGHPPGAGDTVQVGVRPGAGLGSYTVAWRVISADTHPVSGAFTFSVGHPSAATVPVAAPPSGSLLVGVLYGIVRAVAYAAFAALVGAGALLLFCRPTGGAQAAGRRTAFAGWTVLLPATAATLLLQGPYGDGTGLGSVVDPGSVAPTLQLPLGIALEIRLLLLAVIPVYLRWVLRQPITAVRPTRTALVAAGGLLGIALAATWSVSGHAADGLQPGIALPVDVAHLLAMGVWLGGLFVLALALRRPDAGLDRVVARFSPIAFGCVVLLAATGTYQSWRQLGSWSAFLDTDYGRLLLVKILAVAALLGVASVSRRAVHRTAGAATTLRRTVLVEAVIAVAVVGVTAMLVNADPGRAAEAAAHQGPVRATLRYDTGGPGGTGTVDVVVSPARTGPDTVAVTVHGPSGPLLDPAELDVELSLPDRNLGPFRLDVTHGSTGRYEASGQIPLAGQWQVALTVRTSDIDETTVRLPLEIP
ncbi:FixH family protein [Pseudonocardia sp.]|uniref:copper resistance CopC/CopD family protein n=1 Tax=Pseudonocardia sp. TaxID=60912 RepID=UPI0031FC1424